jgi:SAM-dependent methyltransferase
LARVATRYLGVEPDPEVSPGDHVGELHRCLFEDAPIPAGSVDVAFAVMVLEHLPDPQRFWDKLYTVLASGGVFWGLTLDARHWFCQASLWAERLRVKDAYLSALMGKRGAERYENYPVYYRTNSPRQIARLARRFRACDFINFAREGQLEGYLPRVLHPLARRLDRAAIRGGRPGTLLAVRAVK